ncbi:BamA/TamA family outer membrane protein [Candidatus Zixiibacteriota bacterium]
MGPIAGRMVLLGLLIILPGISDCLGQDSGETTIEPMPIFMYDTDVGFGYGAKAFLLNTVGWNESFDLILFNSTGGERWYKLVFSLPDFELRQGTVYPFSVDLSLEYDKFIKNKFFGIGNQTRFSDEERYTKELSDVKLTFSRGFTPQMVAQVGIRFRTVRNFNFQIPSIFDSLAPLNRARVTNTSIYANFRYDTRDSFINPSRGIVLQGEVEHIPDTFSNDVPHTRLSGWFHYFRMIRDPGVIFAFRAIAQDLEGEGLPVQVLLPVGGVNTMRGMAQDRFLDSASALINAEVRFPLYRRLGGVVGFDAGKVWNMSRNFDLERWASNLAVGLRYYLETFVVRVDIGFGQDAFGEKNTGFYFNFGHLF